MWVATCPFFQYWIVLQRPGLWTMGNLGRPGYGCTIDGVWVTTTPFPPVLILANQTNPASLNASRCPLLGCIKGEIQHAAPGVIRLVSGELPGYAKFYCKQYWSPLLAPAHAPGSAPEIDVIAGQVASHSDQFAPFTHDYLYGNTTTGEWVMYNPTKAWPNSYKYAESFFFLPMGTSA